MRALAVVSLSAIALVAFAPSARAQTANEDFLFGLISDARADRDVPELSEHNFILGEAREHSDDMAARNSMGHFGFDGRAQRIQNADNGISYICENVAYARGYASDRRALKVIFNAWKRSAGHRRCMLDQNGHRTRSAAVGLTKRGNTWWATFITAQDRNP
jgi:uncharacterized protein YkwD